MEAGERYSQRGIYNTPISIFDVIRINRSAGTANEEKNSKNTESGEAKEKEPILEFYFPKEIF